MTDWIPRLGNGRGPRYAAIVTELEDDIAAGRVKPGTRLLPQRELAERLGLSVGTISKAYAEAEQRGLISGEVGRGTFVQRRRSAEVGSANAVDGRPGVNLALNVPPSTGEEAAISGVLSDILTDGTDGLLSYLSHQGRRDHREATAQWLGTHGMPIDPDRVFITHGAQHALSIALSMVATLGDTILTESLTYSGMVALSVQCGYRLAGVLLDRHGIVPEALEDAFARTGARVLYAMPTLQTPTGSVMPLERRYEIAEILRRHDAYLLEDDAYGFLFETPLTPISALATERSFYAVSFAKCLAPGLRIGALVAPEAFRDRCINAIRATGWMAAPIMAEAVARLISNGGLTHQAKLKRERAVERVKIAQGVLSEWLPTDGAEAAFHVWLPLPAGRTVTGLVTQAAQSGITLVPPHALLPHDPASQGIRLCLGAPRSEASLERALQVIRRILESAETMSLV